MRCQPTARPALNFRVPFRSDSIRPVVCSYRMVFSSRMDPGGSSESMMVPIPRTDFCFCGDDERTTDEEEDDALPRPRPRPRPTPPCCSSSCCSSRGSASLRESFDPLPLRWYWPPDCDFCCLMSSHSTRKRFQIARRKTSRNCVHNTKASFDRNKRGTNLRSQLNRRKESAVTMRTVSVSPYRRWGRRQIRWQVVFLFPFCRKKVCALPLPSVPPASDSAIEGIPIAQAVWATL
mmetsp:Transcript_5945/g.12493  ORF Transcript_5945/g.12493 Transcript_5945/m.12493 type:complete len:235 (-) Transcript_5945:791-1495(-)